MDLKQCAFVFVFKSGEEHNFYVYNEKCIRYIEENKKNNIMNNFWLMCHKSWKILDLWHNKYIYWFGDDVMYIKRERYLSKIRPFYDVNLIKVLTGVRRCGKSILLEQIKEEFMKMGLIEHILLPLILKICNLKK